MTRDEARGVAGEEHHRTNQFPGFAFTAQWRHGDDLIALLVITVSRFAAAHVTGHVAGRNHIDPNIMRAPLCSQVPCRMVESRFCCPVAGKTFKHDQTAGRAGEDD